MGLLLTFQLTRAQALSGDTTYSTVGFDFVWNSTSSSHYTLSSLIETILDNSRTRWSFLTEKRAKGGIPCEPNSIFPICNNYPQVCGFREFLVFESLPKIITMKW